MHTTCTQHASNIHSTCTQHACNLHTTVTQHVCNVRPTCIICFNFWEFALHFIQVLFFDLLLILPCFYLYFALVFTSFHFHFVLKIFQFIFLKNFIFNLGFFDCLQFIHLFIYNSVIIFYYGLGLLFILDLYFNIFQYWGVGLHVIQVAIL